MDKHHGRWRQELSRGEHRRSSSVQQLITNVAGHFRQAKTFTNREQALLDSHRFVSPSFRHGRAERLVDFSFNSDRDERLRQAAKYEDDRLRFSSAAWQRDLVLGNDEEWLEVAASGGTRSTWCRTGLDQQGARRVWAVRPPSTPD